jgi:tight adherence protein B
VLANSAVLIRDRFKILGDIATFTAQGRMTALILCALPLGIAVMMFMAAPSYFVPMLTTEEGRRAMMFAGGAQLLGILAIRRIVNIRV